MLLCVVVQSFGVLYQEKVVKEDEFLHIYVVKISAILAPGAIQALLWCGTVPAFCT